MMPWILGGLLVLACLVWCGTWIIQIGAYIVALLFRLIVVAVPFLAQTLVALVGSAGWCVWWCFNREAAMESLRKAQAGHKGGGIG